MQYKGEGKLFLYAIRGATTVDENTADQILERTTSLLETIIEKNKIHYEDIVSIIFTGTRDLDAQYPALAARKMGMVDVPLFCCQEMYVKGSLEKCIRVLMHIQVPEPREIKHVYLEKAKVLRPDLADDVLTIAIDGPAGAGKSTIAKVISEALNIPYLDTGAMYRAIAYKMLKSNIDLSDHEEVISTLELTDLEVKYHNGKQRIILDDQDVTSLIRTTEVSQAASKVAVIPEVRLKLVEIQRKIARENSLVMDGRDIGTYVLPNASLKFYLTASLEERAKRRWKEMKEKGIEESIESIKQSIKERDDNDKNRSFAPLKQAEDAIVIDTTNKSIEQVSEEILGHINSFLHEG